MKIHLYSIAGAMLAVISLGAEVKAGGTFPAASDAGITTFADDDEALELPYTPSSSDFTFFHGPTCTRDWGASSGQISFWGGGTADAYAVMPKLHLSQGKAYELSFSTRISRDGEANYKNLAVKMGLTPDADGLSEILWDETIMSTTSANKKQIFSVPSDGDYYIAFWCHGQTSTWDIYVNDISLQEVDVTPRPVTDLSAEPAPNGELKVNLTWTNPSETTVGETLDIIEKVEVLRGSDVIETLENVEGGKVMSYEDAVDQAGKYTYSVIPYLGDKPGEAAEVTSSWVGKAVSITSVSNVVAEPVVNSTTSVSLTFDRAQAVEGYLDQADVAYKITRSTNGGSEETLENEWKGELPYVDNTITELGSYVYRVYTVYNGNTSITGTASNSVVTGGYANLPYFQDFTTSSSLSLFTLFHGPDGSRDWGYSSGALQYWGGPTADAYAVMPVFHLEAGKDYELKFDTRISSSTSSNYKNLEIKIGQTPDVAGLDKTLWSETVTNGSYSTFKQIFSVENTGDYYIGFHCFGTANSNDIYVDNVNLEEVVATPKAVTELTATPAPLGALKVSLSWVNPSETVTGETVDVVDKVEVLRGNDVVATLENLDGGSESSYDDTVDAAGTYTYKVIPYLGQKAGEE
ncbi:MAG: choice-of-anchor J domain-containing protein, partial [Duncaniella sp.]|nr:choice-of-anchor J domain-containing protein [Duncaniella sp.]